MRPTHQPTFVTTNEPGFIIHKKDQEEEKRYPYSYFYTETDKLLAAKRYNISQINSSARDINAGPIYYPQLAEKIIHIIDDKPLMYDARYLSIVIAVPRSSDMSEFHKVRSATFVFNQPFTNRYNNCVNRTISDVPKCIHSDIIVRTPRIVYGNRDFPYRSGKQVYRYEPDIVSYDPISVRCIDEPLVTVYEPIPIRKKPRNLKIRNQNFE